MYQIIKIEFLFKLRICTLIVEALKPRQINHVSHKHYFKAKNILNF